MIAMRSDHEVMNRSTILHILTIACASGLALLPLELSAQDSPAASNTSDAAISPAEATNPMPTESMTPADTARTTQTTSSSLPSVTPRVSNSDEGTQPTIEHRHHTPWGLLGLLGLLGLAGLSRRRDRMAHVAPETRRDQSGNL